MFRRYQRVFDACRPAQGSIISDLPHPELPPNIFDDSVAVDGRMHATPAALVDQIGTESVAVWYTLKLLELCHEIYTGEEENRA